MFTRTFASLLAVALFLLSFSNAAPTGSVGYYPTPSKNSTLPAGPTSTPSLPVCNAQINPTQQWYKCATGSGFEGFCSQSCSTGWCADYEPQTCTPKPYSGSNNEDYGSHQSWEYNNDQSSSASQSQSSSSESSHTATQYSDNSYSNGDSSSEHHSHSSHGSDCPCNCPCCHSNNDGYGSEGHSSNGHESNSQSTNSQSESSSSSSSSHRESSSSSSGHKSQFYVCRSNGFQGRCSENPCGFGWCVDYIYKTYTPAPRYPNGHGGNHGNSKPTPTGYTPLPTGTSY